MSWLQNAVIVVISFLLARIIIDADLHHHLIRGLLLRSQARTSALVTAVLLVSYGFSMFFSNSIVVLSMIPIVKFILEGIKDMEVRKKVATHLVLALIYGANIGGMASLIGSPLNLMYIGYIELMHIPGRENITFFSWLLVGIPATLAMIFISRMILKISETNFLLKEELDALLDEKKQASSRPATSIKKYILFSISTIAVIILFTALQFFYKPGPILGGLNIIDLLFLFYLLIFLFFSFIFPRGRHLSLLQYKENLVFLLLMLLLFPFIYILETFKELRTRLRRKNGTLLLSLEKILEQVYHWLWSSCCQTNAPHLKSKKPNVFVSLNRLIYDLPFMGLLFMGMVLGIVFVVLKLGDNPATPAMDGYAFNFFDQLANHLIPANNQVLLFLLMTITISLFITEFINNATVVIIMFPLVMKVSEVAHLNPLFLLLAIVIGASGAFMTPIATSVNAISYASVPGVSLKQMIKSGFLLNIASSLWLTFLFYLFHVFFLK